MTIKEILNIQINKLKENKIEQYILKAKLILAFVLNVNKEYLITNNNKEISKEIEKKFEKNINKLIRNIPLQYIIKKQEFMKLDFFVNKNVLIPRQDTEILVYEVINLCENINNPKILDLCTGSGAIAISLFKNIEKAEIIATDISKKAITIAKINSLNNELKVKSEIKFLKSNLFNKLDLYKKDGFDIIVSNPPYIKTQVLKNELAKEIKKEPKIALDGGKDGLKIYKKIINKAYLYLKSEGFLCLEIGYDQKEEVIKLLNESQKYKKIYSKKDLSNNDRIIICQRK